MPHLSARIALATCAELPDLIDDEPLLRDALHARGHLAEPVVWDDEQIDWEAFDVVVVRQTWDYQHRRDAFLAWAERPTKLLNPAEVIAWNTDKHYLAELPHAVATEFVEPGRSWRPPGDGEYVIKPTISAGSRDTARYGPDGAAQATEHLARLHRAGRTAMVQPYLNRVDADGETALIYFEGSYSHAIRKGPMLRPGASPSDQLYLREDIEPRQPSSIERTVAEEVLDALPWAREELLYARVDLIPGPDATPRLVELELTEPSLFLSHGNGAADRLADRIIARVQA